MLLGSTVKNGTSQPDLSLIIPVYNLESELDRCLQSIVTQACLFSLECLIIDDGSTDGSLAVAQEYERRYPFVRVGSQTNSGVGIARNMGLQMAQGRYIWCVDSDDRLLDNAFVKLYPLLKCSDPPDVLLVAHAVEHAITLQREPMFTVFEEVFQRLPTDKTFTAKDAPELMRLPFFPWNKIIKNDLVQQMGLRFSEALVMEDILYSLGALVSAASIKITHEIVYLYTIERSQGQNASVWDERRLEMFKVFDECDELMDRFQIYGPIRQKLYGNLLQLLAGALTKIKKSLRFKVNNYRANFLSKFSDAELNQLVKQEGVLIKPHGPLRDALYRLHWFIYNFIRMA